MNGNQFVPNQTYKINGLDIHTIEGTIHTIFIDEYINKDNQVVSQYKLVLDAPNPFGASPRICFTLPTSIADKYYLDAMCGRTIGLWFKFRSITYQKDDQERYISNPIITAFEDTYGQLKSLLIDDDLKNQISEPINPDMITAQDIIAAADKLHNMLIGYKHLVSTNMNHSLDMVSKTITDIKNKQAKDDDDSDLPF